MLRPRGCWQSALVIEAPCVCGAGCSVPIVTAAAPVISFIVASTTLSQARKRIEYDAERSGGGRARPRSFRLCKQQSAYNKLVQHGRDLPPVYPPRSLVKAIPSRLETGEKLPQMCTSLERVGSHYQEVLTKAMCKMHYTLHDPAS